MCKEKTYRYGTIEALQTALIYKKKLYFKKRKVTFEDNVFNVEVRWEDFINVDLTLEVSVVKMEFKDKEEILIWLLQNPGKKLISPGGMERIWYNEKHGVFKDAFKYHEFGFNVERLDSFLNMQIFPVTFTEDE